MEFLERLTINLNVQLTDGRFPFDTKFLRRLTINPSEQLSGGQFPFEIIVYRQLPSSCYLLLQSVFHLISEFQNNFLYLSLLKVYIKSSIND